MKLIKAQQIRNPPNLEVLLSILQNKEGLSVFDLQFQWTVVTWWDGTNIFTNNEALHQYIEALPNHSILTPKLPFQGGLVGWFGYEAGHFFDRMPLPKSTFPAAEMCFWSTQGAIIYHQKEHLSYVVGTNTFIKQAQEYLHQSARPLPYTPAHVPPPQSHHKNAYIRGVKKLLEAINKGEIYQTNLSWKMPPFHLETPLSHWLHLRKHNPARYGAFLQKENVHIVSNSPEKYIELQPTPHGIWMHSLPIKGTRPVQTGQHAKLDLWNSQKERAELTMIVDLVRNDFGRVCQTGSIHTSCRRIKRCGDLYHAEQGVKGWLQSGKNSLDAIAATFPPGSVTGAPKIAAMNWIHQLEPTPRGPYTGALGFFSSDGQVHFNVAIRTIVSVNKKASFHLGAGIVADSNPQQEWKETLAKGAAMTKNLCQE